MNTDAPTRVGADAPRTTEATRQWRYLAARRRVRQMVDGSPPLTAEQRETLALILCPDGLTRGGGAA